MTTDDDLLRRNMEVFRATIDRQSRGVCGKRLSRFRPPDYTDALYCLRPVARPGATYCGVHEHEEGE